MSTLEATRRSLQGEFWNQPYGAARTVRSLGGEAGILEFFRAGRELTLS